MRFTTVTRSRRMSRRAAVRSQYGQRTALRRLDGGCVSSDLLITNAALPIEQPSGTGHARRRAGRRRGLRRRAGRPILGRCKM